LRATATLTVAVRVGVAVARKRAPTRAIGPRAAFRRSALARDRGIEACGKADGGGRPQAGSYASDRAACGFS